MTVPAVWHAWNFSSLDVLRSVRILTPFEAAAARNSPSVLLHSTVNKSKEEKFGDTKKSGALPLVFKSVIESLPVPADPPSGSLSCISPPPPSSSCSVSVVPIPVPGLCLEAQYHPRTRLKSETTIFGHSFLHKQEYSKEEKNWGNVDVERKY
jgi:hypothetical protein